MDKYYDEYINGYNEYSEYIENNKFIAKNEYVSPDDYTMISMNMRDIIIICLLLFKNRQDLTDEFRNEFKTRTDNFRDRLAEVTNNILNIYGGDEIYTEDKNRQIYEENKEYLDNCASEYELLYKEFIKIAEECHSIIRKDVN